MKLLSYSVTGNGERDMLENRESGTISSEAPKGVILRHVLNDQVEQRRGREIEQQHRARHDGQA